MPSQSDGPLGLKLFDEPHMAEIIVFVHRNPGCLKTDVYRNVARGDRMNTKLGILEREGIVEIAVLGRSGMLKLTPKGKSVAELLTSLSEVLEQTVRPHPISPSIESPSPMIISASRRTDIPAFHSEWMMNRLRAGCVLVRNPVSRTTVHKIDLSRDNVDCIVFITKDPGPMVDHMKEIGRMGHTALFQVTMTPYHRDIEPYVRFKADISDSCEAISDIIGRDRMSWRYDPVILNRGISMDYHRRKFEMLCREASRWTDRCIFSFVDIYGKLIRLEESGAIRRISPSERTEFVKMASKVAEDHGMILTHCCGTDDFSRYGIEPRGCIDRETMRMLDIPYETPDVPVRDECRCVKSIDIGEYGTCGHGCIYCYAGQREDPLGRRRVFSEESEILWGAVMPRDRIVDLKGRSSHRLDSYYDNALDL